jgi:hypothetical protein
MPVLGLLILFNVSLLKHFGNGPAFEFVTFYSMVMQCKQYWWAALLQIQNYYNPVEVVSTEIELRKLFNGHLSSFEALHYNFKFSLKALSNI